MNIFEDLVSQYNIYSWNKNTMSILRDEGYYVYKHYLDGKLFYIGKGKGLRCFDFKNRGSAWKNYVDGREDEVLVEVVRYFSCENEAFNFESNEIVLNRDKYLVNVMHNHIGHKEIEKDLLIHSAIEKISTKEKRPINIIMGASFNDICFEKLTSLDYDILISLMSKISTSSLKNGKIELSFTFAKLREIIGLENLQAIKVKKKLLMFQDDLKIMTYKLLSRTHFKIEFSEDFSYKLMSNENNYLVFNFNEFLSLSNHYSKIIYLKLSENRMRGDFTISKSNFIKLINPPPSYNDYDFLRKIILPALDENREFFPNLAFSNLNGNSIPDICKFSFFRKRTTKMEKDLKKADPSNILELIEKYKN